VAWQLTSKEYRSRGITAYGNEGYTGTSLPFEVLYAYQYWPEVGFDDPDAIMNYTSLFINLVDDYNENGQPLPALAIFGSVNDQVSGYNLASIQTNYLKHCYSHSSLVPYLKAYRPTGVTNAQIDLLMSFYD